MLDILMIFLIMIVLFVILFWVKKTLFIFGFFFKIFGLVMIVMVVGSALFGYFIVKDATDFMSNFGNSTSMFILKSSNNGTESFMTGVTISPGNKSFYTMNSDELEAAEKLYRYNRMDTLNEDYYKVFVIDFKSFNDLNIDYIEDKNIELKKDEIERIMLSDTARAELADIVSNKTGAKKDDVLDNLNFNNEEIKGYIFSHYLSTAFDPADLGTFLKQLKKGNIKVYKETALFKAVKVIPSFMIDTAAKRLTSEQDVV